MRQKDLVPQSYGTVGVIVNYYSEYNLEKKVLKLDSLFRAITDIFYMLFGRVS